GGYIGVRAVRSVIRPKDRVESGRCIEELFEISRRNAPGGIRLMAIDTRAAIRSEFPEKWVIPIDGSFGTYGRGKTGLVSRDQNWRKYHVRSRRRGSNRTGGQKCYEFSPGCKNANTGVLGHSDIAFLSK